MKEIYICSSNTDRNEVLPVVEMLEASGLSCCVPGRDILYEYGWEQTVSDAINEATMIIYFESPASRKSFRLMNELEEAKKSRLMKLVFEAGTATADEVLAKVRDKLAEARKIKEDVSVIVPYSGSEPYIFVSYSHMDKDRVFGIIRLLQGRGYRVWFDEGIDPGTEWDDNIAEHLTAAGYVIPCFSENFFNSQNCNDELFFARELGLSIMPVYLEDVQLEPGAAMRFGRLQALFYHKYTDKNRFLDKVAAAEGIDACRDKSSDIK